MREWIQHQLRRRPWWMNLMLLFCAYMALVYVPGSGFTVAAAAHVGSTNTVVLENPPTIWYERPCKAR